MRKSRALAFLAELVLNGVVGTLDLATGYEVGLSVFYVLPVALVTWLAGRFLGTVTAVVSAGI